MAAKGISSTSLVKKDMYKFRVSGFWFLVSGFGFLVSAFGVGFHVSRLGLRLSVEEGTPLPPWSMKRRELQARGHQNPRGIRVYGQNLEPQGLTLCFHSLAYGLAPLLLDTLW